MGIVRSERPRVQRDAGPVTPSHPDPPDPGPTYTSREGRLAVDAFHLLVGARERHDHAAAQFHLTTLNNLGWMVVPIAERRKGDDRR